MGLRVSVLGKKENAIKFLSKFLKFIEYNTELVLLEITLSENLYSVKCSNDFHSELDAVAGEFMEKIKEIEVVFKSDK